MKTNSSSNKFDFLINEAKSDFNILCGKKSKYTDDQMKILASAKLGALAMGSVGTVFALTAIPFLLSGSLIIAISMVAFAALLIVIAHDIYQMAKHQQDPMNELAQGILGGAKEGFKGAANALFEGVKDVWNGKQTDILESTQQGATKGALKGWDEGRIAGVTQDTILRPVWQIFLKFALKA